MSLVRVFFLGQTQRLPSHQSERRRALRGKESVPATVGCIGLGDMGGAMSETIAASYDLTVFDLSEEAGAKVVDKGARAAESGAGPAPTLRPLSGSPEKDLDLAVNLGLESGRRMPVVEAVRDEMRLVYGHAES